ncbi:hypothetical protein D3C84_996870 [compost metagenome]
MAVGRHEPLRDRERMVIRGRFTEIKAHEGDYGGAVGQYLHIAGNKPEMLGIPGTGRLVVSHLNYDVTKFDYFRRCNRWTLRGVDSRLLLRQIPRKWGSVCQGFTWRLATNCFDGKP